MSNNWDGKGLPEVGQMVLITNVEKSERTFAFNNFNVVVDSVYKCDGDKCLAISHEDIGIGAILFSEVWVKPIKSDRDKAINELTDLWDKAWNNPNVNSIEEAFGLLYDAGFKKQSGE